MPLHVATAKVACITVTKQLFFMTLDKTSLYIQSQL